MYIASYDMNLTTTQIAKLALESQLDPRTVKRAVQHGINSLKSEFSRERLAAAAKKLGIKLA